MTLKESEASPSPNQQVNIEMLDVAVAAAHSFPQMALLCDKCMINYRQLAFLFCPFPNWQNFEFLALRPNAGPTQTHAGYRCTPYDFLVHVDHVSFED